MAQGLVYINEDMDKALKKLSAVSRLAIQAIDVDSNDEGLADAVFTIINGVMDQWLER